MAIIFNVDRELADALQHVISQRVNKADIREGDLLITLMAVARERIRAGKMNANAKKIVIANCYAALTREDRKIIAPGTTLPQ